MTTKRVRLKEKSPEFAEEKPAQPVLRGCHMPGCRCQADFRAPKDRSLSEYYWFCQSHITEYNAAWDFFSGMSQMDVEKHIRESIFGDRPTWVYTANPGWEDELRAKAGQFRDFGERAKRKDYSHYHQPPQPEDAKPEQEALAIMGLQAPVTFVKIKERYRTLVKAHHPDRNPGNAEAEEIVKRVNMAYTILRAAHEKYEVLKN